MNLTENYRLTSLKRVKKIPTGLDAFVYRLIGKFKERSSVRRKLLRTARKIDAMGKELASLESSELKKKLSAIREKFKRPVNDEVLAEAFALVQESVLRVLGYRPYVEQIAGALALYNGYIAEMSTGEGKTVTAAMCGVIRGWSGRPCHVITANDYLASRDAQIMGGLYNFCGVSVGAVTGAMKPPERRAGYAADVTYSTAKEVLADFLRDRIAMGKSQNFSKRILDSFTLQQNAFSDKLVQRGLFTAIVDEADNVLIDEAVTPLIISREKENKGFNRTCEIAFELSNNLVRDVDYKVDIKLRTVRFLVDMDERLEEIQDELAEKSGGDGGFCRASFLKDLVRQALIAKELFFLGRQYLIEEGKIIIVDESTGRKMPMRSWNGGLHQMIELKEGLELTGLKETEARMSFQRFFRLYKHFSGMTGTGKEASSEFWMIYGTPVLCIPNHRKNKRKIYRLKTYSTKESKRKAIMDEVVRVHKLGRPILIGTKDIDESETFGRMLSESGLHCKIINAVRSDDEANIIAEAGKAGAITVATNMAGRGTDIKIPKSVKQVGGLHVIATECNMSSRIDRQLFGRSARQGDPGSASHYASFEDEVLRRNLPSTMMTLFRHAGPLASLAVKWAQYRAGRKSYQSRVAVQRTDTWLEESLGFSGGDV
ncbi:MAG: hypothetical protein IJM92_14325 [Fibrobacter sp.]|uniref:preprotein translocase subunit SecA n=1 Tax=Fibrobacter sp. TaxID=35828 RepID=UPI0025BE4B4D|nr:hypothetical protein [Fibrobacter sp.]MBQ7080797.1 hypothetical protein [Fibrobacter sp.]